MNTEQAIAQLMGADLHVWTDQVARLVSDDLGEGSPYGDYPEDGSGVGDYGPKGIYRGDGCGDGYSYGHTDGGDASRKP
jgi:hypothetical protein